MKVLRVQADGVDEPLSAALRQAFQAFNRGLDIRLRFLAIGIDERVLTVGDAASAAERVDGAITEFGAEYMVLDGDGEGALAAATAAARRHVPLVRLRAGRRDGDHADAARAVDRIATILIASNAASVALLADEGLEGHVAPAGEEVGKTVIRMLRRLRQRGGGGTAC